MLEEYRYSQPYKPFPSHEEIEKKLKALRLTWLREDEIRYSKKLAETQAAIRALNTDKQ